MNSKFLTFSQLYKTALLAHLANNLPSVRKATLELGREAILEGLRMPDIIRLHEQIMIVEILSAGTTERHTKILQRGGIFFAWVTSPLRVENTTGHGERTTTIQNEKIVAALSRHSVELAASKQILSQENSRHKAAERSLKKSEARYMVSLEKSRHLQKQLRRLSHRILFAQEDERKKISRELHDVIAQALLGINIRLAALKKEATLNSNDLGRNISQTQKVLEKSTDIIHQFARELRPAALDDLGLIPALHSLMQTFTDQTGALTHLTAFAEVEGLDATRRTVLFRLTQEALTNVARHAQASKVDVLIERLANSVCLKIQDNGTSFDVKDVLHARDGKHLGLLGMRERVEMVGGHFLIESSPGNGTSVIAQIPIGRIKRALTKKEQLGTHIDGS